MGQVETIGVTTRQIIRTPAFRVGFLHARAGLPFDAEAFRGGDDWSYERGRMFALIFPAAQWSEIMSSGNVTKRAVIAFDRAWERRLIV